MDGSTKTRSSDETGSSTFVAALVTAYVCVDVCQFGRTTRDGCYTNGSFQRADDYYVSTFGRCGSIDTLGMGVFLKQI